MTHIAIQAATAQDAYGRTEMGIHPDGGNIDATLGCIGLSAADTMDWHDALKARSGQIGCVVQEQKALTMRSEDDGIAELYEASSP